MEHLIPRLEQRFQLRLKLLPQFWQLLNMLQLPITQLKEKLEAEFEENPLLEIEQTETEPPIPDEEQFEFEEENAWEKRKERFTSDDEKKRTYLEDLVTKPETLHEHLIKQLHLQSLNTNTFLIGEEIIGNIDDNGYLKIDLNELAEKFKISVKKIEKILNLIQQFDPIGVGARNLKECLVIQLNARKLKDKIFEQIVEGFLEELASHDYETIEKKLKISDQKMTKFLEILKTLDPKPGRNYTQMFPRYAIPELFLEINPEGIQVLKINEKDIPKIKINQHYLKLLKDPATPSDTKKYLREKMKTTKELIQALAQRNSTILKIATFITEYQKDFFTSGKSGLKPLTLRVVSESTGLDESTISRAVNGKYMETPHGIIELREFFSSQVKGISSKVIKEKIKDILVDENPKKPLSDNKISELLKKQGTEVARRTVAKYREEMKILPAKLRRK
ncbi:MAG: RNA polymerase factor sigma-54 [Candidatus Saelkia tenebricola]|nr:RNA polymerase factor sigma-54 [Candidatus Saelkia tenebricola]